MNNSVEQLKLEVDVIKKLLNDLKNNVSFSEIEKKNKAEAIRKEAEATKQKIQDTIKALENKTDDTSKMEKEKAITLLSSFDDITILYNSIINPSSTNSATNSPTNPSTINTGTEIQNQPPTENKNVFSRVTQWVKDQVSSVFDKEKWSSEGGKNILRTAGLFGALTFAYKGIKAGIKKLFGKDEEDDEYYENEEKESKKKKKEKEDEKDKEKEDKNKEEKKKEEDKEGFRNKWYGKALKWLGIAGAAGGGIFSLSKWLHKGVDDDSKEETSKGGEKEKTPESSSTKKESEDSTTKKDSEESSKSNESEQSKEGIDKSKNTYTNPKSGLTYNLYDQALGPWGKLKYKGRNTTVANIGCMLTSAACVTSAVDPSKTPKDFFMSHPHTHVFKSIPKMTNKREAKQITGGNKPSEIKENLRKGYPAIFMVRGRGRGGNNTLTTSQHYMAAVDIREKNGKEEVFIANTHNNRGGGRISSDKAFASMQEASIYTPTQA